MGKLTILSAIAAVLVLVGPVWGDYVSGDYRWKGGDADWNAAASNFEVYDGASWSVAAVLPTTGNLVYLNNGSTVVIVADVNAKSLIVAEGDGSSGAITQTAGTADFTNHNFRLGKMGPATYNLSGGRCKVYEGFLGGAFYGETTDPDRYGTFNISGTGTLSGRSVYTQCGEINQTGGLIDLWYSLTVGYFYSGAVSEYTISGGSIDVNGTRTWAPGTIKMGHDSYGHGIVNINAGADSVLCSNLLVAGRDGDPVAYDPIGTLNINANPTNGIEVNQKLHFLGNEAYFNAAASSVINMTASEEWEDRGEGNQYYWYAASFDIGGDNARPDPVNLSGLNSLTLIFKDNKECDDIATFEVAGDKSIAKAKTGDEYTGLLDNFALHTLKLDGGGLATVQMVDNRDNIADTTEAAYVRNLVINSGSTLDLNGQTLYYLNGMFNPNDVVDTAGGGELIQILAPPPMGSRVLSAAIVTAAGIGYDGTVLTDSQTAANYTQLPVAASLQHEAGGSNMLVKGVARSYYNEDGIHHVVHAVARGQDYESDLSGSGTLTVCKEILVSPFGGLSNGQPIWATGTLTLNGLLQACRHEGDGWPDADGLAATFSVRIIRTAPGNDLACFFGTISLLGVAGAGEGEPWVQIVLGGNFQTTTLQQVCAAGLVVDNDFAYIELDHIEIPYRVAAVVGQAFWVNIIFDADAFIPAGAGGLGAEVAFGQEGELIPDCHTPEPTTVALLLIGLPLLRRRRKCAPR
ncbi:MAG: PEP-CTERM sorting domain-containing protein [Phycisphaerae bacterium]|nr:PEP-CTERM sorting domain-containing protein [Phycisphaerae bacterium]